MKTRVLVVEPYAPIRELLEASLRHAAHEVAAVDDGNAAVAAMESEHFPCVIVGSPVLVQTRDATMLFLEYIERHCPQWKPCLIVVTTHVESGQVVAASRRLRVCAVLAKPFAAEDLLSVVRECVAGMHEPTRWIGLAEPPPARTLPSAVSR